MDKIEILSPRNLCRKFAAVCRNLFYLFTYLFIIKSYTQYKTDRMDRARDIICTHFS